MTRFILFYIAIGLVLVGCSPEKTNGNNEKNTPVIPEGSNVAINTEITPSTEQIVFQDPPEYEAKIEGELSVQDSNLAYEMCVRAMTDFYKAVWNGSDIELDTFIHNENLKQYTERKIQYLLDLYPSFTDSNNEVQNIEVSDWEVEYTDAVDGGFLYIKLPVEIIKTIGSRGEVTEFLVRNVNGKLVIVDWYSGGKDSYDFLVRGENQTIDDPNIWYDTEWVKELDRKQMEFSGSVQ